MNIPAVSVHAFYTFLLVMARVGGMMLAAPLLGNRSVPQTVKLGLTFVFTLALVPLVEPKAGPVPTHLLLLAFCVLKDGLFGLALGFVARILFTAVEMAGYFVDTQMGFGFANLVDPFSEQQSSVLSVFQFQLATTIFLLMNGHLMLLGGVVDSYGTVPAGMVSPQGLFGMSIVPLVKTMFVLGFRLALPAAGVLVVVDMAFGLVARMVPQMNVFMVGMPAKIIIGLATVALLLPILSLIVGQVLTGTEVGMHTLLSGVK